MSISAHEAYNDFLDVPEVARRLKKQRRTVVRLCETGELPAIVHCGEWLVRQVDVDAYRRHLTNERLDELATELNL